ncbi:hypothetical protein R1flu_028540 [Riccia fluitans]|uniref:Uncharacterized protein n=1 Tax=Riccia fluitans TaxID=41844 RepID=A0ABD1XLZ0_9MARC
MLREIAKKTPTRFRNTYGFLETIDEAIRTKERGGTLIYILYSVTNSIWRDRTQTLFSNRRQTTPLLAALEQARVEIEGSFSNKSSITRWLKGLLMLNEINRLIETVEHATIPTVSGAAVGEVTNQPNNQPIENRNQVCVSHEVINEQSEHADNVEERDIQE